ncbi:putative endopeptidase Clp [Helianthus annuus]|nr:putative endopeptidase Clp [Helianthus annuus]KAJ0447467.1 putative endopeptidase Clp [Helianthus annuus]KAJ0632363.1 putative endopeptidase Clp [Helianthus annuus]
MMPIGTPRVPYRVPGEGTWQWVDLWNALYRERVIFIGQNIDEEFSNQLLATMLYLDSVDNSKRMYMYINGPGGDLTPSMAIYDTMQSLQSPIGTHCVGYAYNLAGFLLAAGEKGQRFAMPLSRVALESPAGAARGQADDIQNEANELLRIRDYLFKELAEKTGQPVEQVHKDLSRIKRFNAQEALDYGLIDRIVRPPRIKADAPRKEAVVADGRAEDKFITVIGFLDFKPVINCFSSRVSFYTTHHNKILFHNFIVSQLPHV